MLFIHAAIGQTDPFVFVVNTNNVLTGGSSSTQFTLPGTGTNYRINWRDLFDPANIGSEIGTDGHTIDFGVASIYEVSVDPENFQRINFANGPERLKIIQIDQWGDVAWTSLDSAFFGCQNLTFRSTVDDPDLSKVSSMVYMFRGATAFDEDLSGWDVSNVTNMNGVFFNADAFNQDLSAWDVSNVRNMAEMFTGTNVFDQDLSAWDVSGVVDMSAMFNGAELFNQDISSWNVSNVTNMARMFRLAKDFNQNINDWDVSKVTDMEQMFQGDITTSGNGQNPIFQTNFNQPLDRWNVSSVIDMSDMFNKSPFDQSIGSWNVASVQDMNSMFRRSSFNQDVSLWNVSSVSNMGEMFRENNAFDQNLGSWDLSSIPKNPIFSGGLVRLLDNATAMSGTNYDLTLQGWAFQGIGNLTITAQDVTYCYGAFARDRLINELGWVILDGDQNCSPSSAPSGSFVITVNTASTGTSTSGNTQFEFPGVGTYDVDWVEAGNPSNNGQQLNESDVTVINFGTSGIYEVSVSAGGLNSVNFKLSGDGRKLLTVESWGNVAWTTMTGAFEGCENLTINTAAADLPDLSGVTDMSDMFNFARNLSSPNNSISNWLVGNVQNMNSLFETSIAFNEDLSRWDVSNVTNMSSMFLNATTFNQEIGSWDVSNVTNMSNMFARSSGTNFFNGDISTWDVSNVTNMNSMFTNAGNFNQDITSWDVSNVSSFGGMFSGAGSFDQPLGEWIINVVDSDLSGMLSNTALSVDNYDLTLTGWQNQGLANMQLGAEGLQFCQGEAARTALIGTAGAIIDAGPSCGDSDGDGIADNLDLDDDNDGISDSSEGIFDLDGDLILNNLDLDSDNDGIPDAVESNDGVNLPANTSGSGQFISITDADPENGLHDPLDSSPRTLEDIDTDSKANFLDSDSDGDGSSDFTESHDYDGDGDALNDLLEIRSAFVAQIGLNHYPLADNNNFNDNDNIPDFLEDTDGDGQVEIFERTSAFFFDTDADGLIDLFDPDTYTTPSFNPPLNTSGTPIYLDVNASVILPVELLYFEAEVESNQVVLKWATGSELNSSYFEIQRSVDGRAFDSLSVVQGAGNSQQVINYHFTDPARSNGMRYYRLMQVDFDGKLEYSPVVVVINFFSDQFSYTLFPNPTSDYLQIQLVGADLPQKVRFTNLKGSTVSADIEPINNSLYRINLTNVPSGIYLLIINNVAKKVVLTRRGD